ncbi:MAG: DUF4468 domain-containing protein [Bacteroidota bacterium]
MALLFRAFTLLLLSTFLVTPSHAQRKKKNEEKIEIPQFNTDDAGAVFYKEVVDQAGTPQQLFDKANIWFSSFYKSPSSVIKTRDKENGVIEGVGMFWLKNTDPKTGAKSNASRIQYYITIKFRDGRYRFMINRIINKRQSKFPIKNWIDEQEKAYNARTADFLVQTDTYFKEKLIPSLKAAMAATEKTGEEDW